MELHEEAALLARALAGDPGALDDLVRYLTPVIHVRVARALIVGGGGAHRNLREEVEDLTQEVYTALFREQAYVLRAWRPDGGLNLRNFVGMIARRKVGAVLSVRKSNPWYEQPLDAEAVDRALPTSDSAEERVAARELLHEALRRADLALSERGRELLVWIVRDDLSNAEIRSRTGLSEAAVYQWRSRILRTLREHLDHLRSERPDGARREERP
ncbi:MAG TPA: sigma-70 family RNA polymerase sigma factor [Myxococcota bacterium]|nr:sigma-70 family RNA polymerase sigma factor [Myxococcota bacterium]